MKRIVYIVFSLCSIGFCGSMLLVEHINLFVGFISFAFTYFLGVYALETFDVDIKDTKKPVKNTYVEKNK